MRTLSLNFHTDAGHGWLEVPKSIIRGLGVIVNEISSCSYQDQRNVYLEEDCDAPLILNELKNNWNVKIIELDSVNESPIRRMKRMWY